MTQMGADEKMAGGSGFERAVAESHDYDEENDAVNVAMIKWRVPQAVA